MFELLAIAGYSALYSAGNRDKTAMESLQRKVEVWRPFFRLPRVFFLIFFKPYNCK